MAKKKSNKSTKAAAGKGKSKAKGKPAPPKSIAENRKANHQYEILETLECGMVLSGSEVKSLRDGKLSLNESYGRLQSGELWLIGANIDHYSNAGFWNHDPKRPRKLLVHRRELDKFGGRARERGLTIVPLRVFFNERGYAKCVVGLCRGKKLHDKRETLKKRDAQMGLSRAMRRR